MSIAVFIATSSGPVRIERIIGEMTPQSNIFLGRGYKPLEPVSSDYDDFVSVGGPVHRAFGPFETPAFRLDVSGAVAAGNSWEFAVFTAHGLAKWGALAGMGDPFDQALVLTGQVDTDFRIGSVGHIPEKLAAAEPLINELVAAGKAVQVCVPSDDSTAGKCGPINVTTMVDAAKYVADLTGDAVPAAPPAQAPPRSEGASRRRLWIAAAGTVALVTGVAMVGYLAPIEQAAVDPGRSQSVAVEPALSAAGTGIALFELRAPAGKSCIDVHFAGVEPTEMAVPWTQGHKGQSTLSGICALRLEFRTSSSRAAVTARLAVLSGKYLDQSSPVRSARLDKNISWTLPLPDRMAEPLRLEAAILDSEGHRVSTRNHEVLP